MYIAKILQRLTKDVVIIFTFKTRKQEQKSDFHITNHITIQSENHSKNGYGFRLFVLIVTEKGFRKKK